jgi:hypothetical protein
MVKLHSLGFECRYKFPFESSLFKTWKKVFIHRSLETLVLKFVHLILRHMISLQLDVRQAKTHGFGSLLCNIRLLLVEFFQSGFV